MQLKEKAPDETQVLHTFKQRTGQMPCLCRRELVLGGVPTPKKISFISRN